MQYQWIETNEFRLPIADRWFRARQDEGDCSSLPRQEGR
jgi:hypothetical protein